MTEENNTQQISEVSGMKVLLLLLFVGGLGIHKFALGKVGWGIAYLLTLGFFGIGVLVDLINLAMNKTKDSKGFLVQF